MRVLLLNYEFPPVGGGAGNATYFLLNEYAKRDDVTVDVITSSPGAFEKEQFSPNITIYKLAIGANASTATYGSLKDLIIYSLKTLWFGVDLMRKNKYTRTHAFFGTPCGFIALLFRIMFGVPYIVSLRGADVPGYKARYAYLDLFIFSWLNRFFIWRYAKKVIANSSALRDLALKTSANQEIEVIPNGIDTETFTLNTEKSYDSILISTGWTRLEKRKGIDDLVRAVVMIVQDENVSSPVRLQILGTGKELDNLQYLVSQLQISESVEFLKISGNTQRDREKVAELLRNSHILCLPSKNEGMSNAVLEGMASGLAVLLTDTGGTTELLEEGANGYIIQKDNPEDIYEKLKIMVDDKELLNKMGSQSRQKAEKMSWDAVAQEYTENY